MICCKLTGGFTREGDFSGVFKALSKIGGVLAYGDVLYFGSDVDDVDEKKLRKILKKYGYKNCYIEVYTANNQPKESEMIQGWLTDWLVALEVKHINTTSQERLKFIKNKLGELDEELDKQLENLDKEHAEV